MKSDVHRCDNSFPSRTGQIQHLLKRNFRRRFGKEPSVTAWAPGRVNLIGEHTDYNDGYVLPIAIDKGIWAAASATEDRTVTLCSGNIKGETAFRIDTIRPAGDWGDYPKGIVAKLKEERFPVEGFNVFFLSDLPIGAGMSSSAAMEVLMCRLLEKLFGFSVPPEKAPLLCQEAEHEFAGTRCGIMDQFVSAMGLAEHALFLDCRTLEYRHIPCSLGEYIVVACDSRVERGLASSKYNKRRAECEEGVRVLAQRFPGVRALRDVTLEQLNQCSDLLPEEIFRRCRHVVSENGRVLSAIDAMGRGRIAALGELVNLSHDSLRDDYEVSCPELDLLVRTARNIDGALGSRLTGAGFGGSTISIIHRSSIDVFQNEVSEAYLRAFNTIPNVFECIASDGAYSVEL